MAKIRDYAVTEKSTTGTSMNIIMPAHEPGDFLLLYVGTDGTNHVTAPGNIWSNPLSKTGSGGTAYRVLTTTPSSSTTSLTLTVPAEEQHAVCIAIKNINTVQPIAALSDRSGTDNTLPFSGVPSATTTTGSCLVFHFINSDGGLALTAHAPAVNIVNSDASLMGIGCAYTYQRDAGGIPEVTWFGRTSDDTIATVIAIADNGSETEIDPYADKLTTGSHIRPLSGVDTGQGDTHPAITLDALGQRNITSCWALSGSTYTDRTTEINNSTAGDVTLFNEVNAAWYFGYTYKFRSMVIQVSAAPVGGTYVWEYYSGSTWTTLTGPSALTAGWIRQAWSGSNAINGWTPVDPTGGSGTAMYFIRYRVTVVGTSTATLTRAHIGGRLCTHDAAAALVDSGLNPYMSTRAQTPIASTINFVGNQNTFGAAINLATGTLLTYARAEDARDFAIDPAISDDFYPITEIYDSKVGFIFVLRDTNENYEIYAHHSKNSFTLDPNGFNAFAMNLLTGEPWGRIGTLNKSAITAILWFTLGEYGIPLHTYGVLSLVEKIVFAGGTLSKPLTFSDLKFVANNCIGTNLFFLGTGDAAKIYAPLQIGGGDPIKTDVQLASFFFPDKFNGRNYFDWNAGNNVAGIQFFGKNSNDSIKFTNTLFKGTQPYRWEFNSNHSSSAIIDFGGSTIVGATVTLQSSVILNSVSFITCSSFTQNDATISSSVFQNTTVKSTNISKLVDCEFTTTGGAGHAIELQSTGTFSFVENTFNGYGATDSLSASIFNSSSGSVIINITNGDIPTFRNGPGSTTQITASVTVILEPIISGTEIRVYKGNRLDPTNATYIDGIENASGSFTFTHSNPGEAGFIILTQPITEHQVVELNLPSSNTTIPIQQRTDRNYKNDPP